MRILYKTANDQAPLGLQNIYIGWCEGDDEELQTVANDIVTSTRGSDIAVWYDFEPGVTDYDKRQLEFMLERMHIAAFVVTNRMLTTSSRALNKELTYMRDHSIAVLPIFMEGTDVGEFYERVPGVGTGVFHDAENYKESLVGALDFLLCDKETADDIRRNAFCGKINIITHPKDRRHLAKMQKMIHDFEFCRDFAITCDDPFGIFQSQELDMLRTIDQADVTLFTVTPNMLQASSKMATILFPHMRDSKRKYIAVEAEETKPGKLASIYKHISEPIKLTDEQQLRERLGDLIGSKSIGQDSPRHLYLMGMAYMYGVGAEVDLKRGMHLINSAAKQGLYEAQNKLVQMYSTGIGAPFDLDSAIVWQRRIIEYETRIYNNRTSIENAAKLAEAINLLGSLYERLDNISKAVNAYVNSKSLCERRLRNSTNENLIEQYGNCCECLGKLKQKKHNIRGAEEDFRTAFDAYGKLLLGKPTTDIMLSVAELAEYIGDICMAKGRLEEAEAEYRMAYERLDYLASEAGLLTYKRKLVACLDKMAQLYMNAEDFDCAGECARIACDITTNIADSCGTVNSIRGCGYTYARKSSVLRNMGKLEEARQALRKAIELYEQAYVSSDTDEAAMDLIAQHEQLCAMSHNAGERQALLAGCERIIELRRELAERHRADNRMQEQLAETCIQFADFYDDTETENSRRLLEEAESIYSRLAKLTGQAEYRKKAADALKHTRSNRIITERVRLRSKNK